MRSIQFMGDGYIPEEHGHIVVMQEGDETTQIKEIGDDGLFIESDNSRFKECSGGVFRGGVLTPGQITYFNPLLKT